MKLKINSFSLLPFLIIKLAFMFFIESFAIILLAAGNISAQDEGIQFTHLTSEDGLSLNSVTCILQDKRGFLWIGTPNGLNKYDGYKFKVYLSDNLEPNSISNNSITSLKEDSKGFIWIGTPDGLNKYDWRKDRFYKYFYNRNDFKSLSSNLIYSIFEDKSGNIWIGTLNGLNRYRRETDDFDVITKVSDRLNPDSLNSVTGIVQDDNSNLWLGTWNGITCIDIKGRIVKQFFSQSENVPNFEYRQTSVIYADNEHNLWIGTNGKGLWKYNQITGRFTNYLPEPDNQYSLSNGYITSILKDKMNNIWIGTLNGLNKYNRTENNFTRIFNNPLQSTSLISNGITSIAEDSSGLIWVGTTGGASWFLQPQNKFYYYQADKDHSETSLISSSVIALYIDKNNNKWIGSMGGLDEIMDGSKRIIHFQHEPSNPNSISNNFIRSVLVDHKGKVWIGTNNDGLNMYDPATGKIKVFTHDIKNSGSISNKGITAICEDHTGTLWFGTWWGLNRFDIKAQSFTRYISEPSNPNGIAANMIWNIFEDSKGMLWIGTGGGGASELNPLTDSIKNFSADSTCKNRLSDNNIYTIFESKDGIIWFGTSNGLNSLNRNSGKIKIYTVNDGLPGNIIDALQEDDKGNLWIATDKGISKFNRMTGVFINYTKRNGLKGMEFVAGISGKSKKGNLYFGSNGILYFNPDSIKDEILKSPVVFTDLKIYNQSVPITKDGILHESITTANEIFLPHNSDVITLEFALLDYFDVNKNTFSYKLEGFDNSWNNVGTRNSATYTNLPPGKYTFIVKATNNNGIKNEKEASLIINIIPAYYQTVWFKVITGFGLLFIIILIYQGRTRAIKKYNKVLENKVIDRTKDLDITIKYLNQEIASKDKFFSIIAHDLRSPFVALLGFSKYLADEINNLTKDELRVISEDILRSAKLTFGLLENLLQWARIRTGRIIFEPEEVNLNKIVDEISELYKINASAKDIELMTDVPENFSVYGDLNMIQTILRNLVSNSIKFTGAGGKIIVKVVDNGENARITVSDTGVGISQENLSRLFQLDKGISTPGTGNEEGSGLGLIICKEFIEKNNGILSVNSKIGEGTEFSFTLQKIQVIANK